MELLSVFILVAFLLFLYKVSHTEGRGYGFFILTILFLAFNIAILLSLVSYQEGKPLENWCGIVGYRIASFLLEYLGIFISYLTILIGLLSSYGFLRRNFNKRTFLRYSCILLSALWLSTLLYYFSLFSLIGKLQGGLWIFFNHYLGPAGGFISILLLTVVSLLPGLYGLKLPSFRLKGQKKTRLNGALPPLTSVVEKKTTIRKRNREGARELSFDMGSASNFSVSRDSLLSLLDEPVVKTQADEEECKYRAGLIEEKLREFGVEGRVISYYPGPVVTRYEYEPAAGIKLSKIVNLADDLALRMKSNKIRIVAPLPEKGLIGIEVPNRKRRIVYFKELANEESFKKMSSKLGFALGVNTAGHPVYADLTKMPHLLIAGATGSGKSVCINTIIMSILFRSTPDEVRFLLIDPKRIELSYYEGIPHLLGPVLKDRKEAVDALKRVVQWMDIRYKHFAKDGVRDIESHNTLKENNHSTIPYILVIIDEFADLILTIGKEAEEPLARLAQMARAVGIHLVVATQRPSVDVITGIIKANFPIRIAFKVPSKVDSRTIIDGMGAEKLLGLGDMLFIPPGTSEPMRLHGPFISEEETKRIAENLVFENIKLKFMYTFGNYEFEKVIRRILERGLVTAITRRDEPGTEEKLEIISELILPVLDITKEEIKEKLIALRDSYYSPIEEMREPEVKREEVSGATSGYDPLIVEAARLVTVRRLASATMLQRKLQIGFARAARIIDQLEEAGAIGPQEGSKPRKVLWGTDNLEEKLKNLKII